MTLQELADALHVIEPGSLSEAAFSVCIVWWLTKDIVIEAAKFSSLNKRLEEIEKQIRVPKRRSSRRRLRASVPDVRRRR